MAKLIAVDSVSGKALTKGGRLCTRCCTTPCVSNFYVVGLNLGVAVPDWNDCIFGVPDCFGGVDQWTSGMGFSGIYVYLFGPGLTQVTVIEDTEGAIARFDVFHPPCPFPSGNATFTNQFGNGGYFVLGEPCTLGSPFTANTIYVEGNIVTENPPDFVFGGCYICTLAYTSGPTPAIPPSDSVHWVWVG